MSSAGATRLVLEALRRRAGARTVEGTAVVVVGFVVIGAGWWGVSGTAVVARQLPYLASGGLLGLALVVVGAVLVLSDSRPAADPRVALLERQVGDLHALLVEAADAPVADAPAPDADARQTGRHRPVVAADVPTARDRVGAAGGATQPAPWVALDDASLFHRPGCQLVTGKPARPVDAAGVTARRLTPCGVCEPLAGLVPPPAAGGSSASRAARADVGR